MSYKIPQYLKTSSLLNNNNQVPYLRLGGHWLRDLGFAVGTVVSLTGFKERIVLEVIDVAEAIQYRKSLGLSDQEIKALLTE